MASLTNLLFYISIFAIGMLIIHKGSDFLVRGVSEIAILLRIPALIIALTIVAYGTSLPELSVCVTAVVKRNAAEFSIGTIVGSNIANILLILALAAVIKPIKVSLGVIKKEALIMLLAALLLLIVSIELIIFRWEGFLLLVIFIIYLICTLKTALKTPIREKNFIPFSKTEKAKKKTLKNILFIIIGFGGVLLGAECIVYGGISIARFFGISEYIIGVSMVAVGTSLPEFVVSTMASWKGKSDIAFGNIIGSNIFNILFIIGVCASLQTLVISDSETLFDMLLLIPISLLTIFFLYTDYTMTRKEGMFLLITYLGYIYYLYAFRL